MTQKLNPIFSPEQADYTFLTEEFAKIPENKIMDFIPRVHSLEMHILNTWQNHFEKLKVPYVITKRPEPYHREGVLRHRDYYTLWKEMRE